MVVTVQAFSSRKAGPPYRIHLANFPSIKPTQSTSFKCYRAQKNKTKNEEVPFAEIPMLIAGETEVVDFFSSEEAQRSSVGSRCVHTNLPSLYSSFLISIYPLPFRRLSCRYLVGVHNKRTGTTTLRPAPLHILTHQVKALKGLQPAAVSTLQRLEARAALGETFGTKKAKQAIRAQERNKVDVSAMEGVADHLQESILKNTSSLPSKGSFVFSSPAFTSKCLCRGGKSKGRQYSINSAI